MNYHSDEWAREQLIHHQNFARSIYTDNQIVGVFCQGSTNYGLDTEHSDFDTKCILVPSFQDIALAKPPISTTKILDNNEHLDAKDIRLYIQCFRKQNLNFLEILFTPYFSINPLYFEQWVRLVQNREDIAHMNPYRAVKSMKGIALEKFHAMEHRYPTKADIIDKYGHDGKQTSHLIRVDDYLTRYIAGEDYESCLHPTPSLVPRILAYKNQEVPLEEARAEAKEVLAHTEAIANEFCAKHADEENVGCRWLLEDVSYEIMRISTLKELVK